MSHRGDGTWIAIDERTFVDRLPDRFDPDGPTVLGFEPFVGEQIDRYLLGDELARGAFGIVFAAHDTRLERDVAIKILNPELAASAEISERFVREARAASRIHHPGIVTMLDWGHHEGIAYIVMDLLPGGNLTSCLQNGPLLPHDAIEIARQIAAAAGAAHDAGVLHRDLKPDNVFVIPDPSMPSRVRVKIIDFGFAKEAGSLHRTSIQTLLGTPRYMSPEQCRFAPADPRSDIYSLGCILFALVTCREPYEGTIEQVLEAHQFADIPRLSDYAYVSPQLEALVTAMLAKDPAHRPQSMQAVLAALDSMPAGRLGSYPVLEPPEPVEPEPEPLRIVDVFAELSLAQRVKLLAAAVACVLVGIAAAALV